MIINGQQAGPFPKEALLQQGLTPQTPVWHQGMNDWRPASQVTELADLFQGDQEQTNIYGQTQPNPFRQYAPGQDLNSGMRGPTGVPHTN